MKIHATFPDAPKHFESMSDAFDYCREVNRPVHVCAEGKIMLLFPSGHAQNTGKMCPDLKDIADSSLGKG